MQVGVDGPAHATFRRPRHGPSGGSLRANRLQVSRSPGLSQQSSLAKPKRSDAQIHNMLRRLGELETDKKILKLETTSLGARFRGDEPPCLAGSDRRAEQEIKSTDRRVEALIREQSEVERKAQELERSNLRRQAAAMQCLRACGVNERLASALSDAAEKSEAQSKAKRRERYEAPLEASPADRRGPSAVHTESVLRHVSIHGAYQAGRSALAHRNLRHCSRGAVRGRKADRCFRWPS